MAGRLMGPGFDARGFDSFWINEALLERNRASLPDLGRHRNVSRTNEWAMLIEAHQVSETAGQQRRQF